MRAYVSPVEGGRSRRLRVLASLLAAVGVASCFLPRMNQPPEPAADSPAAQVAEDTAGAEPPPTEPQAPPTADQAPPTPAAEQNPGAPEEPPAVRDSIEEQATEPTAPSREAVAAARRDSVLAAARRITRAVTARRDSIAAAERTDPQGAERPGDVLDAPVGPDAQPPDTSADSLTATASPDTDTGPDAETELQRLRDAGPTYVSYEEGPRLVWDTEAEAQVATTLLPVIRAEELDANTAANYWLLVRSDGRVDAFFLHTSSGNSAFDSAAGRAALGLLFAPALRDGRPAPLWILREISLLMR